MDTQNNKSYPLITIGMSCYNSADTITRAIESAINQDWPNFEIIIVDDGSKDNSVKVIKDKIKTISNINITLIEHKRNECFAGALNTIIKNAKGEFIAIFDDDDYSFEHRLTTQYTTIIEYEKKANTQLVACYGSGIRLYDNGYKLHFTSIGAYPITPNGSLLLDYLLYGERKKGIYYGGGTPSCCLMTRKSTFDIVGEYDTNLRRNEDADFAIRLALKGGHFIGSAKEIFHQYATAGSDKMPEIAFKSMKNLIEKYRSHLIKKNRYKYALGWAKLRFHHFSNQKLKALFTLLSLGLRYPIQTTKHFFRSAPNRFIHETKIQG